MPSYNSNTKEVLGKLRSQLEGLPKDVVNPLTRVIAADLVASNIRRIHNEGKAVDGSDIGSYGNEKYKEKRKDKGKRVDKVNLVFSGKLEKELSFQATSDNEAGVGFLTSYGSDVSEYNEEQFNKKIWGVTSEDEEVAQEIVINRVRKHFNI